MKRGFTIVELLVVITVIVTLMAIMFRLGSASSETAARNKTIDRLQRLENCISGYYAAFGSYPPVKVHGSRDIFCPVNKYGISMTDQGINHVFSEDQIRAALESQPISMDFPYPSSQHSYVDKVCDDGMARAENGEEGYVDSPFYQNRFDALKQPNSLNKRDEVLWSKCQLFRFGLLSYLLPRYLVMMGHDQSEIYGGFKQWSRNNELPCRFEDGTRFAAWEDLNQLLQPKRGSNNSETPNDRRWEVEAIPSQAVTARWLPNLEGILAFQQLEPLEIFGITVSEKATARTLRIGTPGKAKPRKPKVYPLSDVSGQDDMSASNYALDGVTCLDGWDNEFYYYSPAPYQRYRLWSAGPNGMSFPPWISPDEIAADSVLSSHRKEIMQWISDDIVNLSH